MRRHTPDWDLLRFIRPLDTLKVAASPFAKKEVDFVPQKSTALRLMETSVTDNHWSVRARDETAKPSGAQTKQ